MSANQPQINDRIRIPTGIDFLDGILDGGQIPNGVHGLLGPIGAGKTTLATMIAIEGALREFRSGQNGKWLFVSVDERARDIFNRAISHVAMVRREAIREITHAADADDTQQLDDGETTRLAEIMPALTNNFQIIDFSSCEFPKASGPIKEISVLISEIPQRVAGIVIDYAGLAVQRSLGSRGLPERCTSRELRKLVADCRSRLATQFNCPIWLVHQLNGNANRRIPGLSQHHGDAANCRSFGNELDVCVVLGTKDKSSGCLQIRTTKAPSQPTFDKSVLLSFHPQFATIEEDYSHRIHPVTLQIERIENRVKADDATKRALERIRSREKTSRPRVAS